jgi:hypothetical protein
MNDDPLLSQNGWYRNVIGTRKSPSALSRAWMPSARGIPPPNWMGGL